MYHTPNRQRVPSVLTQPLQCREDFSFLLRPLPVRGSILLLILRYRYSTQRQIISHMASTKDTVSLSGQCACGAIQWTSTQPATNLDFCYCKQCQLVSGAPVVAWLCIPRSSLSFSGPGHRREFRLSGIASRSCCADCGGTLTLEYDHYPERPWVAAGTVTCGEGSFPKAGSHMFVSSKPSWFQIADDGVRRCEGFDEAFVEAWPETVIVWKAAGLNLA